MVVGVVVWDVVCVDVAVEVAEAVGVVAGLEVDEVVGVVVEDVVGVVVTEDTGVNVGVVVAVVVGVVRTQAENVPSRYESIRLLIVVAMPSQSNPFMLLTNPPSEHAKTVSLERV